MKATFSIALACAALLPAAAMAQTEPTAFAERAQTFGTGQDVHLYNLSPRDAEGTLRCYDVTMTMPVGTNGRPGASAPMQVSACPKIKKGSFAVGSYVNRATGTYTCALEVSSYVGRNQYDLRCSESVFPYRLNTYTWFSGPIKGNPLEEQLLAQKLNTVPGSDELAWGNMSAATWSSSSDYSYYNCINFHELISARQVGDTLTLVGYGTDTTADCQVEFIKTAP